METLKDFPKSNLEQIEKNREKFREELMAEVENKLKHFADTHKFLVAMDERVEEKQVEYGDGWKTMSIRDLSLRVRQNYKEWLDSWRESEEVERRKLVDLANLCRFLWERLGE